MTSVFRLIIPDLKNDKPLHTSNILMKMLPLVFIVLLLLVFGQAVGQNNKKPKIVGQVSLSVYEEQAITLSLSHLYVEDRDDWFYPWGFSLGVYPGTNYSLSGHTVTPVPNFSGTLSVPVTVNDGEDNSEVYYVSIQVVNVNDAPVITGQTALSTNVNTPITIQFLYLTVSDPDNTYPSGFGLTLYGGSNYTVSGNTVTPAQGFIGTISVPVTVNDGASNSNTYSLIIEITSGAPVIVGQSPLSMPEDQSITIALSHLRVDDPDSSYPSGFSMAILTGANYTFNNNVVTPAPDFHGNLAVGVTVNDGKNTSKPYNLIITVTPLNDAPRVVNFETDPLGYSVGKGAIALTEHAVVEDPDNAEVMLAEIAFDLTTYRPAEDVLFFENTANIKGAFDARLGVMALFGKASIAEYNAAIRAVRYDSYTMGDAASFGMRKFNLTVSDGTATSEKYERIIKAAEFIADLEIPNGFTPNGDQANDTWIIRAIKNADDYNNALVRVYTKSGKLVYENKGFDKGWDGRYQGDLLPAGMYFYTIDLNVPFTRSLFRGAVTILR